MSSVLPSLSPPATTDLIRKIQSERKRYAVAQARRAPFFKGRLDHVNIDRLDDPAEWNKVPILDKEMLRSMSDAEFYRDFCLLESDGDSVSEQFVYSKWPIIHPSHAHVRCHWAKCHL